MRFTILILVSVVIFTLSTSGFAQEDFTIDKIYLEHGLSQSTVVVVFQDSRGYTWIGTQSGLNIYDGQNFKVFKNDSKDPESISSNDIFSICEDATGNIWIGTASGLNKLDITTGKFERFLNNPEDENSISHNTIISVLVDSQGWIWAGTLDGLNHIDLENGIVTRYYTIENDDTSLVDNRIGRVFEDSNGDIWVGTKSSAMHKFVKDTGSFRRFILPRPDKVENEKERQLHRFTIFEESPERFIVGDCSNGLFIFDRKEEQFADLNPELNALLRDSNFLVTGISRDDRDKLWICTFGGGLLRISADYKTFRFYNTENAEKLGIDSNHYVTSFKDKSGLIWVGSLDRGVKKIRLEKFERIVQNKAIDYSLSAKVALSVTEDSDRIIWVGSFEGLDRVDRKNQTVKKLTELNSSKGKLRLQNVLFLREEKPGSLLIGGYPMGLIRMNTKTERAESLAETLFAVNAVIKDEKIMYLAAANDGILRINLATNEQSAILPHESANVDITGRFVVTLAEGSDGKLWVGTNNGLILYDPASKQGIEYWADEDTENGLNSNDIVFLYASDDGGVWVCSSGGLQKIDKNGTFTTYTKENGLPDNLVYSCMEDDAGNLWIGTNNGISRFNLENKDFHNYYESDGLQSREFNQAAVFKNSLGEIFFGTMDGVILIDPQKARESTFRPQTVITSLSMGEADVRPAVFWQDNEPLMASYEQRDVTIRFSGMDYSNPEGIRYLYRLDGYDRIWKTTDGVSFATYTNLPAGRYQFNVKSSNRDGNISDKVATVVFDVSPPFWQSWWFILLLALFVVLAVLGIVRFWTFKIRRQRDVLRHEVHARTAELEEQHKELAATNKELEAFSYSLSHDLRTPLNAIQGYSEMLKDEYLPVLDVEGQKFLSRIISSSDKMNTLINDMLKLAKVSKGRMDRAMVNLSYMVSQVLEHYKQTTPERNVEIKIADDVKASCDENLIAIAIENLLANAWKFTGKSDHARIEFGKTTCKDCDSVFFIKDNGVGFKTDSPEDLFIPFKRLHMSEDFPGSGVGLATVQRVIERHGGKIWAEGETGQGATFYFTVE